MGSTGSKSVTLGFTPKLIKIYGVITSNDILDGSSLGVFDGTSVRCSATISRSTSSYSRYYDGYFQMNTDGPSVLARADGWSFTANGFNYNVASSSANVTVWYEAYA